MNGIWYKNHEIQKAYDKYIQSKKSCKADKHSKWFDYWLDYLFIRNKHNND